MSVLASREGPVLTLTIDREERRNALSADVLAGLLHGVAVDALDPSVQVVVLASAGEKAFCAGADLETVGAGMPAALRELMLALRSCPRPVVARVQGLALAGGLGLMLACDVVVAADTAEFGTPEVHVGLWPFLVSALLARHAGPKRALDLMLTGRRIDAATALEWGLVSRVVPRASLDPAVSDLASELAAKSPQVLREGKAAYHATADAAFEPALRELEAALVALAQSPDAREGMAAFLEKRAPRWTGS